MRLVVHRNAYADLDEIFNWIASDSIQNAISVSERIKVAIRNNISAHPYIGKLGLVPGTRELVVTGLPYIIVYDVDEARDTLTIRGVIHGARDR